MEERRDPVDQRSVKKLKVAEDMDIEHEPLFTEPEIPELPEPPKEIPYSIFKSLAPLIAGQLNDVRDILNLCDTATGVMKSVCHNRNFWLDMMRKYHMSIPEQYNSPDFEFSWEDSRHDFILGWEKIKRNYYKSNVHGYGVTLAAYMAGLAQNRSNTFATSLMMTLPKPPLNSERTYINNSYYSHQYEYRRAGHIYLTEFDDEDEDEALDVSLQVKNIRIGSSEIYKLRYNFAWSEYYDRTLNRWAKRFFRKEFDDLQKEFAEERKEMLLKRDLVFGRIIFLLKLWFGVMRGVRPPKELMEKILNVAILDRIEEKHIDSLNMPDYAKSIKNQEGGGKDDDQERRAISARRKKKKGKLALCFMITGDLHNLELWENWWKGNEHLINVYSHYSRNKTKNVTQKILKDNRVPPVPTRWGDISLVYAERQLYREAYKDKSNKFFILLSGTCVPVRSFEYIYDRLMRDTKKGMVAWRDTGRIDYKQPSPFKVRGKCDKYLRKYGLYKDPYYAGDQWKALSRPNVKDFFKMFRHSDYVELFTKCMDVVPESLAPDEFMYINYMAWKYRGDLASQMRNRLVTFVDFKGKAIHPITYRQITPDLEDAICETNALFVRKIVDPLTKRILKQTPIVCGNDSN